MNRDARLTRAAITEIQKRLEDVYKAAVDANGSGPVREVVHLTPIEQSDFSLVWPLIARAYILEPHAFVCGASSRSQRCWIFEANGGYTRFGHLLSTAKVEWVLDVAARYGWMIRAHHIAALQSHMKTTAYVMSLPTLRKWIHKVFPLAKEDV